MIFHLANEIPRPVSREMNEQSPFFTEEETRILKTQIRKNAVLIDHFINRLDLIVNKERHPQKELFIEKIRQKLEVLMDENDTFRAVLWRHFQKEFLVQGEEF